MAKYWINRNALLFASFHVRQSNFWKMFKFNKEKSYFLSPSLLNSFFFSIVFSIFSLVIMTLFIIFFLFYLSFYAMSAFNGGWSKMFYRWCADRILFLHFIKHSTGKIDIHSIFKNGWACKAVRFRRHA